MSKIESAYKEMMDDVQMSGSMIAYCMKDKALELERELTAVTEESDKYRGLLIRLYNDLFVHHKGEAVRDLKILFREENYN
jgi:hypothetical protein